MNPRYKTERTIDVWKQRGYESIAREMERIVSKMSLQAQEIIEKTESGYVTGEIVLYNLLTTAGVEAEQAAKYAVRFPDTKIFHPLDEEKEGRRKFKEKIAQGKKPAQALEELVNEEVPASRKRREFLQYLKQNH
ncbi:hypothetical protein HZB00_03410 [Candidatus Woesearchaeota archaeon]|nr:hypothetical protein [Candidatus Woesearchaeota archaeon]